MLDIRSYDESDINAFWENHPYFEGGVEDLPPPDDQTHYVYGQDWVVLQNDFVYSANNLSFLDKKLIPLLSPMVRAEMVINPDGQKKVFTIHAKQFQEFFGYHTNHAYKCLIKIAEEHQGKVFRPWNFSTNAPSLDVKPWYKSVNHQPDTGSIDIELSEEALSCLSSFDKNNPYTKYKKHLVANLNNHGNALFELLVVAAFRRYKKVTYTIEYLREKFGCKDKYSVYALFKKHVIDAAIQNLEKAGVYKVDVQETKFSRNIRELTFTFAAIKHTHPSGYDPKDGDPGLLQNAFRGISVPLPEMVQMEILSKYKGNVENIQYSVKAANTYIARSKEKGRPITNIMGIYISALKDNWGEAIRLEIEQERLRLEEEQRQKEERKQKAEEKQRRFDEAYTKALELFELQPDYLKDMVLEKTKELIQNNVLKNKFEVSLDTMEKIGQDKYSIIKHGDFKSFFIKAMVVDSDVDDITSD